MDPLLLQAIGRAHVESSILVERLINENQKLKETLNQLAAEKRQAQPQAEGG